jgi:hypothetical protein
MEHHLVTSTWHWYPLDTILVGPIAPVDAVFFVAVTKYRVRFLVQGPTNVLFSLVNALYVDWPTRVDVDRDFATKAVWWDWLFMTRTAKVDVWPEFVPRILHAVPSANVVPFIPKGVNPAIRDIAEGPTGPMTE